MSGTPRITIEKRSRQLKRYWENKDKDGDIYRKRAKEWQKENPGYLIYKSAQVRAKSKNIPFDLTPSDIVIPAECPALGIPLVRNIKDIGPNSPTLDRFIPSLGYVRGNVRVISNLANRIKTDATTNQVRLVADWMERIENERIA
jgi:hypothetical protein